MSTNPIILADGVFDPLHDRHVTYLVMAGWVEAAMDCELVVQVSPQTKRCEYLSQAQRASMVRGLKGVSRTVECRTTLQALQELRPRHYVKGADWWAEGIPAAEQTFCTEQGIQVHYLDTGERRSSTALLRAWADLEAWKGLQVLDVDARVQELVPFDPLMQGYLDYDARVAIEAKHPDILAELCQGKRVLDVGCGPGHLVRMLRDRGVKAIGMDPHLAPGQDHCFRGTVDEWHDSDHDVVVCREVLEHIPVREWGAFLAQLFRVAKERVYITTRFTRAPAHPWELTDEHQADPSHITLLPQPFVRALCVVNGGTRDTTWEQALDWQQKGRVLVYKVTR